MNRHFFSFFSFSKSFGFHKLFVYVGRDMIIPDLNLYWCVFFFLKFNSIGNKNLINSYFTVSVIICNRLYPHHYRSKFSTDFVSVSLYLSSVLTVDYSTTVWAVIYYLFWNIILNWEHPSSIFIAGLLFCYVLDSSIWSRLMRNLLDSIARKRLSENNLNTVYGRRHFVHNSDYLFIYVLQIYLEMIRSENCTFFFNFLHYSYLN